MARRLGIPPFTGTANLVCIYKMRGKFYVRKPSSLSGERVKSDPAFQKTMQYAALFGKASGIGSRVYAALPAHRKVHALYRTITGEAVQWLKYAWKEEDIIGFLLQKYTNCSFEALPVKMIKGSSGIDTITGSTWRPLTHRRSVHVFVRNMLRGIRGRQNRRYDRYLIEEERSWNTPPGT